MVRTLLILSKLRAFPAAIEAAADFSKYQVIVKEDLRSAGPLLAREAIDAVILDVELTEVTAIRLIEQVRAAAPDTPVIVVTAAKQREWEEDAYLLGRLPCHHQADPRKAAQSSPGPCLVGRARE